MARVGRPRDADFPLFLTTGRVVSHYLSGTQTRRIGPLVEQYPEPKIELHPALAEKHGIVSGDWVRITTRRAEVVVAGQRGQHDPARHGVHPVSLARPPLSEPAHAPDAGPAQQDPGVQGLCLPDREDAHARPDIDAQRMEETGWRAGSQAGHGRGA